uniref:Uncharacterized protein n=1 Tax=Pyrococcus abyssi TaxID=29292 RepID=A0A5J6XUT8_PYRAY|nr:hypothetical protein [Pyrococcus abyssi]
MLLRTISCARSSRISSIRILSSLFGTLIYSFLSLLTIEVISILFNSFFCGILPFELFSSIVLVFVLTLLISSWFISDSMNSSSTVSKLIFYPSES